MSKLTDEALALHGGCDCTSIKYTIFIPPVSSRPVLTPSSENNNLGPILAPKIFFDHCNKCRRVSGAILQAWLSCPQTWVCWSLSSTHDNDRISLSTSEILKEHTAVSGIISHYESSPGVSRYFCGRCGTNLAYVDRKEDEIEMVDMVLGSLERESLEKEGVKPDRHFYWESGVQWVKNIVSKGEGGEGEGVAQASGWVCEDSCLRCSGTGKYHWVAIVRPKCGVSS